MHQHAMGPMTLFGLGEVVNQNFDEWIYKGLRWINSNNELGFDMEDRSRGRDLALHLTVPAFCSADT